MFEIYSKENCVYCTKIKDIFSFHNVQYVEKSLSDGYTKEEIQARVGEDKKINTVPQVFLDGKHIGGYIDVLEYFVYKT